MGFRLRGGTPKSMKQGIYWVQRHVADLKAAQRRREAERAREEKARETVAKLKKKLNRIIENTKLYYSRHADLPITVTEAKHDKISEAVEEYNAMKDLLSKHIDRATMRDMTKFATIAKSVITMTAKARKQAVSYDAKTKILSIDGKNYDYS